MANINEMKPSIETAKKLADTLEVTLDYLIADGELRNLDKKPLQHLESKIKRGFSLIIH